MITFTGWLTKGRFRRSLLGVIFIITYFNTNSFILSVSVSVIILWVMFCSYIDSNEDKG